MTAEGFNATAAKLRQLVPQCLVCDANLADHRYAQIATTVATNDNKQRVHKLIEHLRQHNWGALTEYDDFQADKNAAIVYVIAGPHTDGMVILIRDPFELYESAEIYVQEKISADDLAAVSALVPTEDWQRL